MIERRTGVAAAVFLVTAAALRLHVGDGYYDWPAPTRAGCYPYSSAPSTVSRVTDAALDFLGVGPIDRSISFPEHDPRGFSIEQHTAIREALVQHLTRRGDVIRDWDIENAANRLGEPGATAMLFANYSEGNTGSGSFHRFILENRDGWGVRAEYWEGTFCGTGMSPLEVGQIAYGKKGCNACHSLDGSASTGPSFKNLFGRRETMSDGEFVIVNEAYIRRSILHPDQEIVKGYSDEMPAFAGRVKDVHIDGIIELLKSLKDDPSQPK